MEKGSLFGTNTFVLTIPLFSNTFYLTFTIELAVDPNLRAPMQFAGDVGSYPSAAKDAARNVKQAIFLDNTRWR